MMMTTTTTMMMLTMMLTLIGDAANRWLEKPVIFSVRSRVTEIPSLTGSKGTTVPLTALPTTTHLWPALCACLTSFFRFDATSVACGCLRLPAVRLLRSDLQMVNVTLRMLTSPVHGALPQIYSDLGPDYTEKVLPSIANEVLKSVVAQFNASQLTTQRQQVSTMVKRRLTERARDFHIIVEDASITELNFSAEYMAAVESKTVASQEAERAKFEVERARQEKNSIVVRAKGEAEVAKMIADACQANPHFLQLRQLEAAREIATTLAHSQNAAYLDSSNLLLDTKKMPGKGY
jgi:regulator of protease activity HflC (stomatin/prohibitin superfamily)